MEKHKAIGIFDSGVGGLTVARRIMEVLPAEDILYLGDTARVPYGIKSPDTVRRYSREAAEYLLSRGIKLLVVACNTSSAVALASLRSLAPIPMIGVIEPGARMAVQTTRTRKVGVIATEATIRSGAYRRTILSLGPAITVLQAACPLFVPLAEEGRTDDAMARLAAREYLSPFGRRIDALVLGCTHYPLLKGAIRRAVGRRVVLVDSAEEVAREALRVLDRTGLHRVGGRRAGHSFLVTDDPARFKRLGSLFLGRPIRRVERITL